MRHSDATTVRLVDPRVVRARPTFKSAAEAARVEYLFRGPLNAELSAYIRKSRAVEVMVALAYTSTLAGVVNIWRSERAGQCRPDVLDAVDRRIAELEGAS